MVKTTKEMNINVEFMGSHFKSVRTCSWEECHQPLNPSAALPSSFPHINQEQFHMRVDTLLAPEAGRVFQTHTDH